MPILPENKHRYPKNWLTEVRPAALEAAEHKCQFCGVDNYAIGFRDFNGVFHSENDIEWFAFYRLWKPKKIKIILTIMHLDHTPENCNPENLKAGCQRCHNIYDREHRNETRKRRKSEQEKRAVVSAN